MKNKKENDKQILEDGLYIVKLLTLNKDYKWSDDKNIYELEPFISKSNVSPLFVPLLLKNNLDKNVFQDGDIIIKYNKKKGYVKEYKTGLKIPIIYKFSRTQGFFVPDNNAKVPIICIGMIKDNFQKLMVSFNSNEKAGHKLEECYKIETQKCYKENFAYSDNQNLLNLPSEQLDELMNEYESFYSDENALREAILDGVRKLYDTILENEQQNQDNEHAKRNYKKYFDKDKENSKEEGSKFCIFKKKKQK